MKKFLIINLTIIFTLSGVSCYADRLINSPVGTIVVKNSSKETSVVKKANNDELVFVGSRKPNSNQYQSSYTINKEGVGSIKVKVPQNKNIERKIQSSTSLKDKDKGVQIIKRAINTYYESSDEQEVTNQKGKVQELYVNGPMGIIKVKSYNDEQNKTQSPHNSRSSIRKNKDTYSNVNKNNESKNTPTKALDYTTKKDNPQELSDKKLIYFSLDDTSKNTINTLTKSNSKLFLTSSIRPVVHNKSKKQDPQKNRFKGQVIKFEKLAGAKPSNEQKKRVKPKKLKITQQSREKLRENLQDIHFIKYMVLGDDSDIILGDVTKDEGFEKVKRCPESKTGQELIDRLKSNLEEHTVINYMMVEDTIEDEIETDSHESAVVESYNDLGHECSLVN